MKTSKIIRISEPTASKNPGTSYTFIKFENEDKGVFFFKNQLTKKIGDTMEYDLVGEEGRRQIKEKTSYSGQAKFYSSSNKIEALKMAVSAFNAGKITEKRIKGMAIYLESILTN